ncbi:hypothetical protein HVMH_1756 [Hydrogenovibrio marinus]|nr:hypothetical protein HVMH_1756 [Hydrogenovibrio marinus]
MVLFRELFDESRGRVVAAVCVMTHFMKISIEETKDFVVDYPSFKVSEKSTPFRI